MLIHLHVVSGCCGAVMIAWSNFGPSGPQSLEYLLLFDPLGSRVLTPALYLRLLYSDHVKVVVELYEVSIVMFSFLSASFLERILFKKGHFELLVSSFLIHK